MAFLSKMFHTCAEVWNKYGTWKGTWIGLLPYLPYLPYLTPPAHTRTHTRVRTRTRVCIYIFSMEGMEVWKSGLFIGLQPSTPVPYLNQVWKVKKESAWIKMK